MRRVEIHPYIVADPEICHGKPTFTGTRVMVWQILEMLAAGERPEAILEDFPSLKRKHLQAALDYAAQVTGGEKFVLFPEHETARG